MSLKELGILPRVGLAFVPWLTGELIDRWSFSCFGSQSPFCIYYFHPPGMDVMFALLVLALFMHARTRVALRVLALVVLGVFVHFLSIGLLVATRGSLDVPGIDTIWLNVIPVAVIASVVTVLLAAVVCGLKMTWHLGTYSALAGIPIAAVFLLSDLIPNMGWMTWSAHWYWAVWHVSICVAIYSGRATTPHLYP